MAQVYLKKIEKDADNKKIVEYLDYLADTLTEYLENIDEENLSDNLISKIAANSRL